MEPLKYCHVECSVSYIFRRKILETGNETSQTYKLKSKKNVKVIKLVLDLVLY